MGLKLKNISKKIDTVFLINYEDIISSKMGARISMSLQQPLDEILCRSFPTTLKGAAREWFTKLPMSSFVNLSTGIQKGQLTICSPSSKERRKP